MYAHDNRSRALKAALISLIREWEEDQGIEQGASSAAARECMSDLETLVAGIQSGRLRGVRYKVLLAGGRQVHRHAWLDLSDGDTNPRVDDGLLTLDLWFQSGMITHVKPLATMEVIRERDGLFTPAGKYVLERHSVQVVDPEPISEQRESLS